MKTGPHDAYLCFIPPPLDHEPSAEDEDDQELTPAHSWSLLQPLSGTCLYVGFFSLHRQGTIALI